MNKTSRIHDEHAQGVIEFALIAMTLMLIFLGTVDFARFLYYDTALRSAARVGAETAINRCYNPTVCGTASSPTTDDYVMQATYCEAAPYMHLNVPLAPTCTPCSASPCTSPCTGTCLSSLCVNDICVNPSGTRSRQAQVTVSVGYNFQPISFLMSQFFGTQSCYTGDTVALNHHTLCAQSVGRVF